MMVAVLQDDFGVATVSVEVAGWLKGRTVEKLSGDLGIKLSQKEAASQPVVEVFSAIGATFDMKAGMTVVRPKQASGLIAQENGDDVGYRRDVTLGL